MNKIENLIRIRKISLAALFLSIPLCFIGAFFSINLSSIIGIGLLLTFLGLSLFFWKCPYCNHRLPIKFNNGSDIDFVYWCPNCNKKLQ